MPGRRSPPDRRLVGLVASPRSGTHFLQSLLRDHPAVDFHSEVFSSLARERARWHPAAPEAYFLQWSAQVKGETDLRDPTLFRPVRVLEYLRDVRRRATAPVVGIDLKYWTWSWLSREGLAVVELEVDQWIHLVRRDLLRGVVSDLLRAARGSFPHVAQGKPIAVRDLDAVALEVQRRAARIHWFRRFLEGRPHVEVVYEDLFEDPAVGGQSVRPVQQARILDALGLRAPGRLLRSDEAKVNPADMRTRVTNYDALEAHMHAEVYPHLAAQGLLV